MRVPEISKSLRFSVEYVNYVVHGFIEKCSRSSNRNTGTAACSPKFSNEERKLIIDIALFKLTDLGLPFTKWSCQSLRNISLVIPISITSAMKR